MVFFLPSFQMNLAFDAKPLSEATIYITSGCNLNCPFCFVKGKEKIPVSEKVIDFTVQKMREFGKRDITVRLFGGEPLLFPKMVDYTIYQFRKEYGQHVRFILNTNLTLLTPEMARLLSLEDVSIITSIHHQDQPGFESTCRAIELLHQMNHFKISANCVSSRYNQPNMENHLKLMKRLGIKAIGVSYDIESISIPEFLPFLNQALRLGSQYGIKIG